MFKDLLEKLRQAVSNKQIICPVSYANFYEILLQSDPVTRKASAQLIDELSKGVSLMSSEEIIRFEILYFIRKTSMGSNSVHDPQLLVWTKVSYTLGECHPQDTPFSEKEELAIQKSFFDQLWSISLYDMFEAMGWEQNLNYPKFKDISGKLNEGKYKYAHENKSFKQLLLSELAGVLDLYMPMFEESMVHLFEQAHGYTPPLDEIRKGTSGKGIASLIYNAYKKNKLGKYLPSFVIGSGLHASVRHDSQRKFKPHDQLDFRHAEAALPYFDYFFTEHSLRDLVTRKNLGFDKKYNCTVLSEPAQALKCVREICE